MVLLHPAGRAILIGDRVYSDFPFEGGQLLGRAIDRAVLADEVGRIVPSPFVSVAADE